MFHYFNAITNNKGDALTGYFVKAVDINTNSVVSIYADQNSTPIVSVSGVTNAAAVDADGNVSFYLPGGTYHLDIYATDAVTFVKRIQNVQMVDFATVSTTGIGYAVGAGGTVTQLTSKTTSVTLNALCGQITTHNASIPAGNWVIFSFFNSTIAATDSIIVNVVTAGGGTHGPNEYAVRAGQQVNGACSIVLENKTGGALAEAVVISFAVIKGVTA